MGICSSNSKRVDAHSFLPIMRPWCRVNRNFELRLFEWDYFVSQLLHCYLFRCRGEVL